MHGDGNGMVPAFPRLNASREVSSVRACGTVHSSVFLSHLGLVSELLGLCLILCLGKL